MKNAPKFILPPSGEWVGPPVLFLKLGFRDPILLDGKKRLGEIRSRGLRTQAPSLTVTNHLEAIKHLIMAGEHLKAAEHIARYYPDLKERGAAGMAKLMGLHHQKLIPLMRALREPSERHKLPRRAIGVVKRLRELRELVAAGEPVTLKHLDLVLGEFIHD